MNEQHAPIRLSWTRISDIGMRSSNQDCVGNANRADLVCFVISDGAGGHEGGEVASRIVVDSMLAKFTSTPAFGAHALISYTSEAIASVAAAHHDMSATLAALLIDGANGQALWAHLGDTRIYLFRDNKLLTVTKDHSLTQQLIDAGYAKAANLREHPQRNILFAAVGAEGDNPVALGEGPITLRADDALLICTDGLWEWVFEADMESTRATAATSEQWLTALCRIAETNALASGKPRDNFSAYAIFVKEAAL